MSLKSAIFLLILCPLLLIILYVLKLNYVVSLIIVVICYKIWDRFFIEGHINNKQASFLKKMSKNPNIINVMQIGFNAGHSADVFLNSNENIYLTSFDLGEHHYVEKAEERINKKYPGRHKLIRGNSLDTIPKFIEKNPKVKFDLIFIDGGHTYNIAKNDLINCAKLAHSNTIVILDDTFQPFYPGVRKAWDEAKREGVIIELGFNNNYGRKNRGDSWGKYICK